MWPEFTISDWKNKEYSIRSRKIWYKTNVEYFSLPIFCMEYLKQGGMCFICPQRFKKILKPIGKDMDVKIVIYTEHNHRINTYRSLVCHNCNSVLGLAGESIERLTSCINYLHYFGNYEENQ